MTDERDAERLEETRQLLAETRVVIEAARAARLEREAAAAAAKDGKGGGVS